jgi:hypothetical protein
MAPSSFEFDHRKNNPAGDLPGGQQQGQDVFQISAWKNGGRDAKVAHGKIKGGRRGQQGGENHQHGPKGQVERDAVVQSALMLKRTDFLFIPSGLQAAYTQALSVQFDTADRAQQAAAHAARHKGFFAGMVETLRFFARLNVFRLGPLIHTAQEGLENICSQKRRTSGARLQTACIHQVDRLNGTAMGTSDHISTQFSYSFSIFSQIFSKPKNFGGVWLDIDKIECLA